MTWHATAEALVRFATAPDTIDEATASSVEQHLVTCAECRAAVARAGDPASLSRSWDRVADLIDRPRRPGPERLLAWLGVGDGNARLVASTRDLRLAWCLSVLGLAVGSAALSRAHGSDGPFLFFAPLIPLAGVAVSFLPTADPAGEAGAATPLHGAALALRRVLTVVLPALLLTVVSSFVIPDVGLTPVWLLPGLALAAGSLALSTVVRVQYAAGGLATAWALGLALLSRPDRGIPVDQTALFGAGGQGVAAAVLAGALIVVHHRRDRFATLEVAW